MQISSSAGVALSDPKLARPTLRSETPGAVTVKPLTLPSAAPAPGEVAASVDKINQTIRALDRNLEFSYDKDNKMNVVKVVDTVTHDVIRQFPTEEVLAVAKALDKLKGMLFRDKA